MPVHNGGSFLPEAEVYGDTIPKLKEAGWTKAAHHF